MSPSLRHISCSILAVVAALALLRGVGGDWHLLIVPLSLLAASSVLIHRASLAPQLLARAIWWANLALGLLIVSFGGNGKEHASGAVLALGTGAALLVAGRKDLGEASANAGYVPASLRSMLMLLMIFALADAQTFLLFGSLGFLGDGPVERLWMALFMSTIGLGYVIGFIGLYRLRVWGVILNTVVSIAALAILFGTRVVESGMMTNFLAVLAFVHILAAAPVALSTIGRFPLPSLGARSRGVVTTSVVAILMALAALMWIAGPTRGY